mgnify:CR=1 FL=1
MLVFLPFLEFKDELFGVRSYIAAQNAKYDSVSRLVFSGSGNSCIIDFARKMHEGKIKTIIGRVLDSTQALTQGGARLKQSLQQAKLEVERLASELHQVAVAVEEMVALYAAIEAARAGETRKGICCSCS